jgi:hypothetical protein
VWPQNRDIFTLALPKSAVHGSCIGVSPREKIVRLRLSEANKNCNLCFPARAILSSIRMYPMYHMYPFKRFKKKPIINPEPGCKIRPKPSILHRCCCSGWRRHRTCFEASKEILNLNSATGPTPTNIIKS